MSSSQNTHRLNNRNEQLALGFTVEEMEKAWQRYVKDGMRNQAVLDLHDYFDFHRNRKSILEKFRNEVLSGRYKPKQPLTIRLEKKYGLTRRLSIPSIEDAIILQTLVEMIHPKVKEKQPSENSFYSRSHGFKPPNIKVENIGDYLWYVKWQKLSKKRFSFIPDFEWICITDIANYFDNIQFAQLRNVLSSTCELEEVILDLLFLILEGLSWRPDYLPLSGRGLPQVDFDAPRLLSHVFLFEIDQFLMDKNEDYFLRWVDDITIPTNSAEDAKNILRDLDELLMTRGLRLNSGKTVILSAKEAEKYLWQEDNEYIDTISKKHEEKQFKEKDLKTLKKKFSEFYRANRIGHWDKVLKRFFTIFGRLDSSWLEGKVPELIENLPQLRDSIFRYYSKLGASKKRFSQIKSFLASDHVVDDVSIFMAAKTLIDWKVKPTSRPISHIGDLGKQLSERKYTRRSDIYFISALWLLAKYSNAESLCECIVENKSLWRVSSYLSRQVAALYPVIKQESCFNEVYSELIHYGQTEALNVILNLKEIEGMSQLPKDIEMYVLHGAKKVIIYPFQKMILLNSIFASQISTTSKNNLYNKLVTRINDPLYQHQLSKLQN